MELIKHMFSKPWDPVARTRNMELGNSDDLQTNPPVDGTVVEKSCRRDADSVAILSGP